MDFVCLGIVGLGMEAWYILPSSRWHWSKLHKVNMHLSKHRRGQGGPKGPWLCFGPHGARIHTHFGDVTVPVLLLTSFWRSFLFLHRVFLSTVQGQTASPNIITSQHFLLWLLHSWESNCYQNKSTVIRSSLQRDPYSKRALLEETWFT